MLLLNLFPLFFCAIQSDDEELTSLEDELSSWRSATAAGSFSDSAIETKRASSCSLKKF